MLYIWFVCLWQTKHHIKREIHQEKEGIEEKSEQQERKQIKSAIKWRNAWNEDVFVDTKATIRLGMRETSVQLADRFAITNNNDR